MKQSYCVVIFFLLLFSSTVWGADGTGLQGYYYNKTSSNYNETSNSGTPDLNQTDATIDYDWGGSSPSTINTNYFQVQWTGYIYIPTAGSWTFYTQSDDGVKLSVNNQSVVDNWTDHATTENSGTLSFSDTGYYPIAMDFYEKTGQAVAKLSWSGPSTAKEIIPQIYLFPTILPEPIVEYRLDECVFSGSSGDVEDSGPNNLSGTTVNGVITESITETGGGICQSADFNGSNQKIVIADNSLLDSTGNGYTMMAWVQAKENKTAKILTKETYNSGVSLGLDKWKGWQTSFYFTDGNSTNLKWNVNDENKQAVLDKWYHIVGVFDGNEVSLYIDGVKIKSESAIGKTIKNSSNDLEIGATGTQKYFNGNIDEVKIYNSGLTESQIKAIYDEELSNTSRTCQACQHTPIVNYRFDECFWNGNSNDVKDYSGNDYNAMAINDINTMSDGKIERAAYFDGDNYIEQNNIYDTLKTTASLSFWIKTTQTGKNNNPWANPGVTGIEENAADDIFWGWIDASGHIGIQKGNKTGAKSTLAINDGEWHHIVLTRDSSSGETNVYVDGTLESTETSATGDVGNSFSSIGRIENSYANKDFIGYLDEIEIYESVLSSDQIIEIYNNELKGTNWDESLRDPVVCGFPEPIANYQMDKCIWDGVTDGEVKDSSIDGIDNSGTITGNVSISKTGVIYNSGLLSGGAIDIDDLNVSTVAGDKTTVAFWMYWDGTNSVMPFGWYSYDLWFIGSAFGFNTGNSDLYGIDSSGLKNGWHHVAAIFTNGDYTQNELYIDSEEQNLTQLRATQNKSTAVVSTRARIGGWTRDNNYRFKDKIDELKIWNEELSQSDITFMYDNEVLEKNYDNTDRNATCISPFAEYRFDECIWNGVDGEIIDSSGNGYDGTSNSASTISEGLINRAGDFSENSVDDYVSLDYRAMDGLGDFTFSVWINTSESKDEQTIIHGLGSDENNDSFQLYIQGSDTLKLSILDEQHTCDIGFSITDGSWHQIAITRTGDTVTYYVDGNQSDTADVYPTGDLSISSGAFIVGQEQDNFGGGFVLAQAMEGKIDEIMIFDTALTADKIYEIYENESNGKNYEGSTRQIGSCSPIANYQMDECSWDGTTIGEVIDSSSDGIDNSGTIIGSKVSIWDDGQIYNAGLLNGGAIDINDLNVSTAVGDKTTVSFWMYWDGTNSVMPFGWNRHDLWFVSGNFGFNSSAGDLYGIDSSGLEDGWHHVTAIFTNGNYEKNELYIDAVYQTLEQKQGSQSKTFSVVSTSARIGGWMHDNGYRFKDKIDELKIWNRKLSQSDITSMYNNELNGKNWDGITRDIVVCGLKHCYSDSFDKGDFLTKWNIIGEDNFTPYITTDNKLMITDNLKNVSAGVNLIGDFPANNNIVEIKFEQNAYTKTNGGDGMVVILSDANIRPVAGGYGGSLGYANRWSDSGFTGGWIGIGIDEFGGFSNSNENKTGGIGRTQDSVTIRGNEASGYSYIANSGTLIPGIDSVEAKNYKYKILIDTRNNETKISVQRDVLDGNGYVTLTGLNEVNATQSATAPDNFQLSFTAATGGAKNIHSITDLNISALYCGTLGVSDENITQYKFDAWDTFRDINDRNISTKIVNQDFNLTIASLNQDNNTLQEYNGTVQARIVYSSSCPDGNNSVTDFVDVNLSNKTQDKSFKVLRAIRDASVQIKTDDNITCSSDNFAVRPDVFNLNIATLIKSGEEFVFDVKAQTSGNSANGYDTNVTNIDINISDSTRDCESPDADFNLTSISFTNGDSNQSARFDDVGVVDINITDKDWAKIDEYDTDQDCSGSWICGFQNGVKTIPYKFDINATYKNKYDTFTYLSQDLNMSSRLDLNITAQNEQNLTTQNYSATCYANNIDINIQHSDVNSSNLSRILYVYQDANDINYSNNILISSDINLASYSKDNFITDHNGTAEVTFFINFDRDRYNPVNQFDFSIFDINVTDVDSVLGGKDLNQSANYYFGRVKTKDITTNQKDINNSLHVEVYSTDKLDESFHQESLNWYVMADDVNTTIFNFNATKDFQQSDPEGNVKLNPKNDLSIKDGKVSFSIKTDWIETHSAYIHVNIPEYLWYSKYTDYNASGDCSNHPCFEYNYIIDKDGSNIHSGTFNGTSIEIGSDYNATKTKKGVKVFR